jgi:RNA polymerase sigma-70 factor (ECF subfamily)
VDLIEDILNRGDLTDYQLAHSARADLYRRLGKKEEALNAYLRALELTQQEPQKRFIRKRLDEIGKVCGD